MEWLNYHHLYYFWIVSREGGLSGAAKVLRVSHATLSTQIKALESRLGQALFTRAKGRLVLTATGRRVAEYATEIFGLGNQLLADLASGQAIERLRTFAVGVTESVPKLIVRQLLDPALRLTPPMRLVCREGEHNALLADLARGSIDLMVADAPVPPGSAVKAFTHVLAESAMGWFAAPALIKRHPGRFPGCLRDAPVLLPLAGTTLRREVDQWLGEREVRPKVVGEFQDSALLKVFGSQGAGAFPAPVAVQSEVEKLYGVRLIGTMRGVSARVFAISIDRVVRHPAIAAIAGSSRELRAD